MIHLANILIVTDDVSMGNVLQGKLQRQRFQARVIAGQAEALADATLERPDIMLLGEQIKDGDPISLTEQLRASKATSDIAACLMPYGPSAQLQTRALQAGIADILTLPISDARLLARLRPLVRLSSMRVELQQRALAAQRFGITPLPAPPPGDDSHAEDRILLIGKHSERLGEFLPQARLSLVDDPYLAEESLETDNFDAAIALLEGDPAAFFDLCVQMRNNPRLFNLPLILVANPTVVDEETAFQHGVTGYFTDPADPRQLSNITTCLVGRQRQRWALSAALNQAARPELKDPATGAFSRDFFDAYYGDRVRYAISHGRPLSIAFIRVPQVDVIGQRFGAGPADHLRRQVAQWIARLLRVEDLAARYEENEFCVLLPGSPHSEASTVINRISGVIAYTDFAVRDVYEAVKVWVRVGSAELTEGDSAASLVARARQAMVG